MRRKAPLLFGLMVLICAGLAAFWYWGAGEGARPDPQKPPEADALSSSPVEVPYSAPRSADPSAASNRATESAAADVVAPPTPRDAAEAPKEELLWTPVYGDALKRGGARAEFALKDAQDQPLFQPRASVRLWRKLGPYWREEAAHFDPEECKVVCAGSEKQGLEPGQYEAEIEVDNYGSWRHSFSVRRGERKAETLRTPYWRRIICIKFVDQHGANVPWISREPSVILTHEPLGFVDRNEPPTALRSPPQAEFGIGLGGGRGGRGGFGYPPRKQALATDDGRFYVAVYAGRVNELTFPFDEALWGVAELAFKERFTEARWSETQAILQIAPDFEAQVSDYKKRLTDDPGRKSHLNWVERQLNPPPLTDESTVGNGMCRVILDLTAPSDVVPWVASSEIVSGEGDYSLQRQGNRWWIEVPRDIELQMWFEDKVLFRSTTETIRVPDRPVHVMQRSLHAAPTAFPRWSLSPTLESWALRRQVQVKYEHVQGVGVPLSIPARVTLDLLRPQHFIGPHIAQSLAHAPELHLSARASLEGASVGGRGGYSRKCEGFTPAGLARGEIQLPHPAGGIAYRVVGPATEALPWVEASLLTLDEDKIARSVFEHESAEAAKDARPDLQRVDEDFLQQLEAAESEDKEDLSADIALPDNMKKRLKTRDQRVWYARNGTWYSTHRRIFSDAHGFALDFDVQMSPGQRYVLYLWSNSRDDMKPDFRIVFEATTGVTDLGAIALPGYTG